jgi:dTDP-4-amino-4,6-dideoxygalactose transaminase
MLLKVGFMKNRNIPLFKVYMSERASNAVTDVLKSGFIGEGPKVKEFEQLISKYFKIQNNQIALFNSATSAEHLLYHYLKHDRKLSYNLEFGSSYIDWEGLKSDDEVLTTSLTCTATNWPIILNGLNLKWVDVDPLTLNMCLDDLSNKINHKTRIVTVVHWGGNPIDLDKLNSIIKSAEKQYGNKILIIEDCAHSFGSKYKNEYVGFTGNFATFSLQAIKHITSIDGGFISSPYTSFINDAKLLRWYGIDREGPRADFRCEANVSEVGFKFHMNDICAAVGIENLLDANKILPINKINAEFYNQSLENIPGVTLIPQVKGGESAYWLYSLHVERRDDFIKYMIEKGISVSRVHERNDKHTCVEKYKTYLPGVDKAVKTMVSIPVGYWVNKEDREYIVDYIKKGW